VAQLVAAAISIDVAGLPDTYCFPYLFALVNAPVMFSFLHSHHQFKLIT